MKALVPSDRIEQHIYTIRGHRVMLDRDLARLYNVKAIALRQQVKRNEERFPPDFMFRLSEEEAGLLVSQNVIPSRRSLGGFLPYAFTEHGAVMLASVLRSPVAVAASIQIVRAFNRLRQMALAHKELTAALTELARKVAGHDDQFKAVFAALRRLAAPPIKPRRQIGFRPHG